ncbi:MAG: hypothetical protein Q7V05_02570 [Methanoregula sp.]|nr:hypothetical protein [Methanoregula sp.]
MEDTLPGSNSVTGFNPGAPVMTRDTLWVSAATAIACGTVPCVITFTIASTLIITLNPIFSRFSFSLIRLGQNLLQVIKYLQIAGIFFSSL